MPGKIMKTKVKKISGVRVIPELEKMKKVYKQVEALGGHAEIKTLANQLKKNIIDLAAIKLDKQGINYGDIDAMREVNRRQKVCEKKGEALYTELETEMKKIGLK